MEIPSFKAVENCKKRCVALGGERSAFAVSINGIIPARACRVKIFY
ncbi:hypothetical protein [Candidatus Allofournierella merdipullorum]